MKKSFIFLMMLCVSLGIGATNVPTTLFISTSSNEVEVPIASIQKITYNEAGSTMYVHTSAGVTSYDVASIIRMTLNNGTAPAALDQLTDSPMDRFTKFEKDGVVYVVKDGRIYTVKGEQK